MSLNGLDDAKVTEAYQSALSEAGGWFLLKYVSRDAVELLARGTGGAPEARGAVAQYDENSPLYGFLLYRRRKVLIKYIPEGTSRLLQARVTVHFTAVTDKFTPHDTVISITTAEDLSDAALSSACSLHTAAPSSCSSSGSSRKQKLDEITEDAEEGQGASDGATDGAADDAASLARPTTATSAVPTIVEPVAEDARPGISRADTAKTAESKPRSSFESSHTTREPKSAVGSTTEVDKVDSTSYQDSLKHYDSLFENGPAPRFSSQTARPSMADMYAEIYAKYQPKVKLGPRPRPSLDSKRPHTSGPGSHDPSRPVSSLPAGLRVATRKAPEPKRPKSRDSSVVPSIAFPPPPPVPSVPEIPAVSPTFSKSPASVKSMPVQSHSHRTGITPEKQRLMRAVELRNKRMKAQKEKEENAANKAAAGKEEKTVPNQEPGPQSEPQNGPAKATAPATKEDTTCGAEVPSLEKTEPKQEDHQQSLPGDSSVDLEGSQAENDDHHSAASPCSPTSAQTQDSSAAPSTRPSSISEDDRPLESDEKVENSNGPISQGIDSPASNESEKTIEQPNQEDEQDSVESTPTIVPDLDSAIPSVEITALPQQQLEDASQNSENSGAAHKSQQESMIVMPSSAQDFSRRSKRESMIMLPSSDDLSQSDTPSRKNNRESIIMSASKRLSFLEVKEKRRAMVDPSQLQPSAENSDAEYLSDDSFMEELQTATVHEAKPISVSKSPIVPFFPRNSTVSEVTFSEHSPSSQTKPGRLTPEQLGRKSSGPWLQHAKTDTVVMAKKINVSSGISQRIKALAEKSNRESSASVSSLATPDASSSIVAQRKSSFFSTPSTGNSPNGPSAKRLSRASFISPSPDRQPVSQLPPPDEQPVYNIQQEPAKPESVQVTARIVRDGRAQKPALTMPTENTPLELHQSPITIDHQKSVPPIVTALPSKSMPPPPTPAPKEEPKSPRPPSSSHSRDPSASALPRTSSESSWRSFGRRLSESMPVSATPRSQSTHSFESVEEKRDDKKEKKDSRTSKLFKRMSSISSISRKSQAISPVLQEEDHQATALPSLREPPPAVQVGDLNIQFPDTLLWKRRWVEIDGSGNLVLSLSRANEQSKGITKRFHLSEFRAPYPPDVDRQELPNSVVLDFIDGRTLQCACETHIAQAQVLQILREAHDAWLAYGQHQ